jgi:dTDP-4-amino-4,6-dideoxygalactose transaminase
VLKLPQGAEVIVPSNTYIATILSILSEGFKPVLVEPDIATYNIDSRRIESAITPRTAAIMVVHLYGKSCDMDAIEAIALKHRLPIIEDCAQSHGAKFKGRMTGTFGLGAFSFYPTKNLGAMGDAGALTTLNADQDEKVRMIRNYGSKVRYYNEVVGMNSRLDEIQAAILRVKLRKLDAINEHKRKLAAIYFEELGSCKDLILPVVSEACFDVFHIFNVRSEKRDELKKYLLDAGIGTEIHYPVAPHRQKAMAGVLVDQSFPIAEEIHRTTLSLPISFAHREEEVVEAASVIKNFFK